jgi:hypothetical protein
MIADARVAAVAAALAVAAAGCGSPLAGEIHSREGVLGTWDLQPTRCSSGLARGLLSADLFSTAASDDTEVVAVALPSGAPAVLVRVPNQSRMVVVRPSACTTFQVDVHPREVLGQGIVEGSMALDCALPNGGHLEGHAVFKCL